MRILYFAELKETLQLEQEDIDLSYDLTVEDFKSDLFQRHPAIKDKAFQVAVNEEFVTNDDVIQQGDTVALIPPVSGG
ncbi:molybdopterin converting factor subunit 1 [Staphylococcus sp. SQ8-PEA]|uniref:Molybdopterin synthase sulfur carrier subunit n=1 Tax=Staphylococcus marylandisciuri TaxID=2981529 RepID=A0ABT2QMH5_9STAP|nr:molybdopterin converting factor subunit 1 [Staphylococcus marylandisciuri]MCU5745177.1 molybdopterin converting factor subunit 1 [Staphylococcus marylandisciuri]